MTKRLVAVFSLLPGDNDKDEEDSFSEVRLELSLELLLELSKSSLEVSCFLPLSTFFENGLMSFLPQFDTTNSQYLKNQMEGKYLQTVGRWIRSLERSKAGSLLISTVGRPSLSPYLISTRCQLNIHILNS